MMALDMGTMSMADDGGLNDIVLEMETLDDTFEKAIARYEFPFADGADLEDMGQKAHSTRVRCYFWDDDTQATYDDHIKLVNLLQTKDLLEFNHPKYGIMMGKVESVAVRFDDRKRTAEVDLSFVEQMRGTISPSVATDVSGSSETAFMASQDEEYADLADALSGMGFDVITIYDPDVSLLYQVKGKGITGWLRSFLGAIDTYLGQLDALQNQVLQPVNSLIASIDYVENLPGRIMGKIAKSIERVATLYSSLSSFPARFTSTLKTAYDGLVDSFSAFAPHQPKGASAAQVLIVKHVRIACARQLALQTAYVYSSDEQSRLAQIATSGSSSFNVTGKYVGAGPSAQVANAQDLESSLVDVRGSIQTVIDDYRNMASLKTMALILLDHVYGVLLEREQIITVYLDNPMPLHLVCLRYGLPYNDADRIVAINSIPNPNAATGAVQIYVR